MCQTRSIITADRTTDLSWSMSKELACSVLDKEPLRLQLY